MGVVSGWRDDGQHAGRNLRRFGLLKPTLHVVSLVLRTTPSHLAPGNTRPDPDLVYVEKRSELSPAAGGLRAS
jgi:hypothetical protein